MAEKISVIARKLGIDEDAILPHGHYIAKVPVKEFEKRIDGPDGKLILVTAMSPTPQGEGKTTTTIGLGDGLSRLGKKTAVCLREPSIGPFFGIKGGGTGCGKSQLFPSEAINLHFTGDMYAVEKSNNLLAAMIDNHLQHGNELNIDPRRIHLKRVIDLNERALREIVIGLGGTKNGIPRKDGFSITPASEIMAILCLSESFSDLGRRLENMVVGFTYDGNPVRPPDVKAVGAMQVLMRDCVNPNLVQTLEGTPAFVHGGPFANIAQGTNSLIATRMALKMADYVITEAGFGTDLGAEKFFHLKCRSAQLKPSSVVIVTTLKAIRYHGGFKDDGGLGNLAKHIENIRHFGLEPVVALNMFADDNQGEIDQIIEFCKKIGVNAVVSNHFEDGGNGASLLAEAVLENIALNRSCNFKYLYETDLPVERKVEIVAQKMYGAQGVDFDRNAICDLKLLKQNNLDKLPVCIAKTPLSLSDDSSLRGRPENFRITVNELRISSGAGFIVAICGSIITMPGLPKTPAAARISVLSDGSVGGDMWIS